MPYPSTYDTFAAHGTLMNEEPLHENVHTQVENSIEAIEAELGLNPSGTAATVVARLNTIEATNTSQGTSISTAQSTANAANTLAGTKTTVTTLMDPGVALGNRPVQLHVGTTIITLGAFGVGTISYGATVGSNRVFIPVNGDTSTSNGGATVGVVTPGASSATIHMQRADGSPGTGTIRVNWLLVVV